MLYLVLWPLGEVREDPEPVLHHTRVLHPSTRQVARGGDM